MEHLRFFYNCGQVFHNKIVDALRALRSAKNQYQRFFRIKSETALCFGLILSSTKKKRANRVPHQCGLPRIKELSSFLERNGNSGRKSRGEQICGAGNGIRFMDESWNSVKPSGEYDGKCSGAAFRKNDIGHYPKNL